MNLKNKSELKENLERAKDIIKEIEIVQKSLEKASDEEKQLIQSFLGNAKNRLKKISSDISKLLEEKKTRGKVELTAVEKKKYLEEIGLEKEALKIAKKRIEHAKKAEIEKTNVEIYKKPSFFVKVAGRLFSGITLKLADKDIFKNINNYLRKANMPYLISTYISIAMLFSLISFFISFIVAAFLFQYIGYYSIIIIFALPLLVFLAVLFYPLSEISSIKTKIDDELPFAIMHMSAIASSGVEPSKIFGILAASPEYPNVREEMRKIVNMINFYGYDLTSALKAAAKTTSSERLSELLNGMSSTISGGGNLMDYLNKIAADSLLEYKLRRRNFITVSETYADIYTGLLIAAPLMFMLILVLMNVVTGNIAGMSSTTLAIIGIGAIIVLNIGFLIFLELSQPSA
ncbi:MAG: type II secretion system F family protein [Candidatus Pacearchaeota archaeon]